MYIYTMNKLSIFQLMQFEHTVYMYVSMCVCVYLCVQINV